MKTYKKQVVDAAIDGLKDGGMKHAETMRDLLEKVYQAGYLECIYDMKVKHNPQYTDIVSDGGMDPRL